MNLADKTIEERQAIEADKAACLIRHKCGHLHGRERQVCAMKLLDAHTQEQQERIRAAMKRRAEQ
jgi:hypothetical protein